VLEMAGAWTHSRPLTIPFLILACGVLAVVLISLCKVALRMLAVGTAMHSLPRLFARVSRLLSIR